MSENNPFGITCEELLELAAQKLADQYATSEDLEKSIWDKINPRIEKLFSERINSGITTVITAEIEKLLGQELVPVNIFGDREGSPTTIRAMLAKRAKSFWDEKVDCDGRISTYGGEPRHKWLFSKVVNDEFEKVIKQNITNIVGAFKDALTVDAAKMTAAHIDSIIKVKTH